DVSFDWYAFAAECPVPIVALRDDGTVGFANRAIGRLVGRGLGAIEAEGMASLVPPRLRPITGGWVERVTSLLEGREKNHLLPLLHSGGAEIEAEWTVFPGHDPAGRSILVIAFFQRTAELEAPLSSKKTELAQLHAIIFEHAPVAIFHTDERGIITACNERFVELIGSSRRHLIGLNTRTLPNRAIVQAIELALGGHRSNYEGEYHSVTGNKKSFVRVLIEPIRGPGGISGCVSMVEDVTEQRKAEELASRSERLASLGTLAAGVVHEVQNPLSFVTASVDLALRQLDDENQKPADIRRALLNAREGAMRVAAIVRDLKMFAGSDEARRDPADVVASMEAALLLVQAQLDARARTELRIMPVPPVRASEPRLVQLFANLLVNAAEAIPEGDAANHRVRVSIRPEGENVRIEVEDTGRGIAPSDAERVFEPFWTNRPSGMGLGLSTCHGIVTGAGGEIFVDPDHAREQKGAKLIVLLPVDRDGEAAVARHSLPPGAPTSTNGVRGRILIVDDEERLAMTLKLALAHAHDVDIATRGKRAVEMLTDGKVSYDAVLCDLMLPDLSGIDVYLESTRAHPELAARFVFLTGGAFQDRARDFLQSIDNPRLDKPFDLEALERIVASRVAAART
ncbi:MAG: PAS domain S-box protein, partial [Polyangiaceae bacterium]|nr:PAS domain S-box protein [Polyangiaceae bacterium]